MSRRPLPDLGATSRLFGHRGYSALAPENTLPAFALLLEHGIPGVELDVQACAGGELVVAHDESLERTAGVARRIPELSLQELRSYDVGSRFGAAFSGTRVPLLSEVFSLLGDRVVYDIELKTGAFGGAARELARRAVEEIAAAGLRERCILSSFNAAAVGWARRASRDIPTALIYTSSPGVPAPARTPVWQHLLHNELLKPDADRFRTEMGSDGAGFADGAAGRSRGRRAPFPEVPRLLWTVDDPQEKRELLAAGVYGVISNDPLNLAEA